MAASPSLTNLKLPPQSTVVSWLDHRTLSSTFHVNSFSFSRRRRHHHQPRRFSVLSMYAKPTILVAEKLGDAGLKLLKEFSNVDCSYNLSLEELCTKISLCDALIVRSGTKVSREVFEASAGRLKVVGRAGVGIDNVDLAAATEHGCLVVNAPTANTVAAAEHGIALLTAMARNIAQADASIKAVSLQAALDGFTEEPPPRGSKLVQHENVTASPHLGASTMEAQEGVAIEIAEAVLGALNGELAATAVNAPMVPAQVLSELKPYVTLSEKLGRLAVQLVAGGSGVTNVKITYASARAPDDLDTRVLRAMIIKGLIEPISSVFVNLVNADFNAKQRGLRIVEERIILDGSPESPLDSIQVQIFSVESRFASAISDFGEINVEGRVKDGIPHLTKVGSFGVDVSLEGSIILCRQVDQPGMIGKVGTILGEENVNVSFMSVGRIAPRKQAIMAIGVDEEPSRQSLRRIGEISAVEEFVYLKL